MISEFGIVFTFIAVWIASSITFKIIYTATYGKNNAKKKKTIFWIITGFSISFSIVIILYAISVRVESNNDINNIEFQNLETQNKINTEVTCSSPSHKCGNQCFSCELSSQKLCCLSETENWCCPSNTNCDYTNKGCKANLYCGDGNCDSNENCSTCSSDCGQCQKLSPYVYIPGNEIKNYCGDRTCDLNEDCSNCPLDCKQCKPTNLESMKYSFQYYINKEPYYSNFCNKINPYNLDVRKAAAAAIKNDPGTYSISQLFDIYDWVKSNIEYQNVALTGMPYAPEEILATESGDCKNQAVLIASMIQAIGGTAKVVIDPTCTHAYTIVRFGSAEDDLSWLSNSVANHYGSNIEINSFTSEDGTWVIFDPAGGNYPGNTLPECTGNRTVYYIDTCLSCTNLYSDMPYTFGDKCYSQCPSGTIHTNNYACSPCPSDSWSYNNECVTCPNGYSLYTNGKCYPD